MWLWLWIIKPLEGTWPFAPPFELFHVFCWIFIKDTTPTLQFFVLATILFAGKIQLDINVNFTPQLGFEPKHTFPCY